MTLKVFKTTQFIRDLKKLIKKPFDPAKLTEAVHAILQDDRDLLRTKYRDHALKGNWQGYRELHISGDWLLIYKIEMDELLLVLTRTGSHDDVL